MDDKSKDLDEEIVGEGTKPVKGKRKREETVSLLDLMRETAVSQDQNAPLVEPAETTETLPPLVNPSPSGDGTLTGAAPPKKPINPAPLPPLSSAELRKPKQVPLERDPEATTVRPRVAFPRGEQKARKRPSPPPTDEAKTRAYRHEQPPAKRPQREKLPLSISQQPVRARQQPKQEPRPARPAPTPVITPPEPKRQAIPQPQPRTSRTGCATRALMYGFIFIIAGFAVSIAAAAIGYSLVAGTLPSPSKLTSDASQFETARIFDRNGNLLYALADPDAGNRTRVSLDQISPLLVNATIATEDSRFYQNFGFDPIGITRAVIQAAQERELVSGASTITQQLVRAVLLDEEERTERTFRRKVREIILSAEISRTYEKNEVLELYLNEIYYGNLAYGIEAASETYFDKSAADLTLAEASLLAGLPQAPALWDPYTAPEKALGRQREVLSQMVSEEYITLDEAQVALDETNLFIYNLIPPAATIRHPHFTLTVLQQAEDALGAQSIYRGGLQIHTTLDPETQRLAETAVTAQRANILAGGANNAAMVVLKPDTGEILALVGSVDFNDAGISGQVNMALAPRQTGSSIKPLVYLAAMEKGWTASTLIWDVATQFPNGVNPPYEPKNYDDQFHGPLRLRPSLGNSYNIPAVKALEFVGVCNFIGRMQQLGLSNLEDLGCADPAIAQPSSHGLALSLGGGEIAPLQMAAAFGTLANQGRYLAPFGIRRIQNNAGEVLFEHETPDLATSQVVRSEHAYLLSHILADNDARQPSFGVNNSLVIPGHRVAAKTGTSGSTRFDVRDAWTIGYTPEVVTAVWVGNTSNNPIGEGQSGTRLASPIWNSFMSQYLASRQPLNFVRPPGVVENEICADSGTQPGRNCNNRQLELFAGDQLPLNGGFDFIQKAPVDLWTNLRANEHCQEAVYEAGFFTLLVSGNESVQPREQSNARRWLEETAVGQNWASRRGINLPLRLPPTAECGANTPRPELKIDQPSAGAEIVDTVEIHGSVNAPNFTGYQLDFGQGQNPGGWRPIGDVQQNQVESGLLGMWDTTGIVDFGSLTLRLTLFGPDNPYTPENDPVSVEIRTLLTLLEPTPTPTSTPTETPTPTMTPTPTGTSTETPTPTETLTPTPTPDVVIDATVDSPTPAVETAVATETTPYP